MSIEIYILANSKKGNYDSSPLVTWHQIDVVENNLKLCRCAYTETNMSSKHKKGNQNNKM